MRALFGSLLRLFVTFGLLLPAVASADPPIRAGEILIKFKAGTPAAVSDGILRDLGASRIKRFSRIHAEHDRITGRTVAEAIGRYRGHPAVEFIEPNYIVTSLRTPDDPRFPELWGLRNIGQTGGLVGADIHAADAWNISTGSHDVVVAVIDTGVDYFHPDLAANVFINPGEIPGNGVDDDGNGFVDDVRGWDFINHDNDPIDDAGHGTHCSGTIGAVGNNGIGVVGVNWSVRILPVKFLSSGGSGTTADAVSSVEYATLMGVDVMSNSWGGGGFSEALRQAIQDARDAGILFVAAAGNSASNNDENPTYPASYDLENIVAVAATNAFDQLATFSSYGATSVDIAAPGTAILSTFPGGGYGLLSGTSMATPHVAGVLALMRASFPLAGYAALKSRLLATADVLPSLTGLMVSGGRANAFRAIALPDSIPPSPIGDLVVLETGSNTIKLRWSATGDDATSGTAGAYEVRYALSPITESTFASATAAAGAPDPLPAGSVQEMEIRGLAFSTPYYVAMRAIDDLGNPSLISNVVSATTLGAPRLSFSPASISEALFTGASAHHPLTLSNVGEGTLDYTIVEERSDFTVTAHDYLPVARGATDPRVGDPVTTGAGGPDHFGYRWSDSDQPGGPSFDWVEISTVGTQIPMSSLDDNFGPIPIGFPFKFYGQEFTQLRTCTHGWISFTNASTQFSNQPLPNVGAPENLLAAFWEDLNFGGVRRAYYYNDGNRLIVEYQDVPRTAGGGLYTFETILYPDGTIVFQYLSMGSPTNGATVGIQNGTRDDGLTIAFNTPYVHNGLAIRINRIPEWFHVTPAAGRILAPGSANLDVAVDATDLVGGVYSGAVRIRSNDPTQPEAVVPMELTVTGVPDIDVSRAAVAFGDVFVGGFRTDSLVVTNRGTQMLHVSQVATDVPDFTVTPASFDLPITTSRRVFVTFRPSRPEPISGTLTIRSDDPDETELRLPLTGTGLVPPDIAVTPASLSADLFTGDSATRSLNVQNSGGSDLLFDVSLENVALPGAVVAPTLPGMSVGDVMNHYAEYRADTSRPAPAAASPSPRPGVIPIWEQLRSALVDSTVIFHDDMESGPNGWTHVATIPGGDQWSLMPGRHHSGAMAWHVSQHAGVGADALQSPTIDLAGYTSALLAFHQWYNFDDCGGDPNFEPDGGIVEVSTNLGATWTQITPLGGYPYVLDDICGNPLAHRQAYSHDGGIGADFVPAVFDLTPFAGAAILLRFHAGWDCGNCDFNEGWFVDDVTVYSRSPRFVSVVPDFGTVHAGASLDLGVTFRAAGLNGGDYALDIVVRNNDPDESAVTVPASLHVTGAPDIALSAGSIDFGNVYVGTARTESLLIWNVGTDVLHVTQVASDHSYFIAGGGGVFNLQPGERHVAPITFWPPADGIITASLTIRSDDPDEPVLVVPLRGTALMPPVLTVSPESIHESLLTNETRDDILSLGNAGGSDLHFHLEAENGVSAVAVSTLPPLAKGAADTRVGNPVTQRSGGPDHFGYRWTDSDEPDGPVFQWVDIRPGGTVIPISGDDQTSAPIPIGFPFPYYGQTFPQLRVCTNGFLSFTSTSASFSNSPLPSPFAPENMVAAFWDDLYIDFSSRAYYTFDGTRFIIQFDNVYHLAGGGPYTFEIILFPNGTILYQYLSMAAPLTSATIGIQNATLDDGLTVVFNNNYVHNGLAVRFSAAPTWLSLAPTDGTVPPGGVQPVHATLNATGLFSGDYSASVHISSDDPETPERSIPVTLHITGVPDLATAPDSLDFGSLFLGRSQTHVLLVTNTGTDRLVVTGITAGLPDYTVTPASFALDPFQSIAVNVTFSAAVAGSRNSELRIVSNDTDSPMIVPLTATAVIPPDIEVTPASLAENLSTGETAIRNLTVRNTGGSDLAFAVSISGTSSNALPGPPVEVPASLRNPTPNRTRPHAGAPDVQAEYEGTFLRFGITEYGEIMPFQYPVGNEHLRVGAFLAGYTVSYIDSPFVHTYFSAYEGRVGIQAVSYEELENTPSRVVVKVVTQTVDGRVRIHRTFTFQRDRKYVRVETALENPLPAPVTGLIFKDFADWDMDGDFEDDGWDYDRPRNMVYAFDQHYGAIASQETPAHMDIYGWNDYYNRDTFEDIPSGPVFNFDGLEVLHFDLGNLGGLQTARILSAYGTGNDLAELRRVMDEAVSVAPWLSVSPESGTVPVGGSANLAVRFDAGTLAAGDYAAQILVGSNDPDESEVSVPASLHVTATPFLTVSPDSLDFGTVFVGQSDSMSVNVVNAGAARLEVSGITASLSDYTATPTSFGLEPGENLSVVVRFAPTAAGPRNGALSILSNAPHSPFLYPVSGSGLVPPVISLRPAAVEAAAPPGGRASRTLSVCNDGGSDLTFDVAPPSGLGNPVPLQAFVDRPKGAADPRPGILGAGGPDAFGHVWLDSDDPRGPRFEWVDIGSSGTPVPFASEDDDHTLGPFPIGFDFPYYGGTFHEFNVCTNGWLSFTSHSSSPVDQPLPNGGPGVPENLLAALWHDLFYAEEGGSAVTYKNDGDRLIVQFNNMFPIGVVNGLYSFQILLSRDGDIRYQYLSLGVDTTYATIGIQNGARDDGLTVAFNADYLHDNLAVLITKPSQWITVSPLSGRVAAGSCADLALTLDAEGLPSGDRLGHVAIASNDPAHPQSVVDVTFHIGFTEAASANIDPNTLNLDSNGRLVAASVELPAGLDPSTVVLSTVRFQDLIPVAQDALILGDYNHNGVSDLAFRFSRAGVDSVLAQGDRVPIVVTGEVGNTTYFAARDTIRVIRPRMKKPNGNELLIPGMAYLVTWENPAGWRPDFADLYLSTDRDSSWSLIGSHIAAQSFAWTVPTVSSSTSRIRAYLYDSGGVMGYGSSEGYFTIAMTTGVEVAESGIPSVHALFQNAPNPFNPVTLIRYELPVASRVVLDIFTVDGRRVRTLSQGVLPAGRYRILWDGRDGRGRGVASGVYLYRLEAGSFVATKRMILLK